MDRQRIGRWGEICARIHLRLRGCRLVAQNLRLRSGEIDLVVRQGGRTRLVEVRTTTSRYLNHATDAAHPTKQQQVLRVTREFVTRHPEWVEDGVSVDVIGVRLRGLWPAEIQWIRDALTDTRCPRRMGPI